MNAKINLDIHLENMLQICFFTGYPIFGGHVSHAPFIKNPRFLTEGLIFIYILDCMQKYVLWNNI